MMGAMRTILDIRTFEDERFLREVARMSVAACAAGALGVLACAAVAAWCAPTRFDAELVGVFSPDDYGFACLLWWLVVTALGTVAAFAAHELVHAALFKAFAPRGARVTFGANWGLGMVYACAEGVVYERRRYLLIALAPSFLVTPAALLVGFACAHPVAGAVVAALHVSGCTGDWAYARAILRDRRILWCEDTAWGVRFYGAGDAGDADDVGGEAVDMPDGLDDDGVAARPEGEGAPRVAVPGEGGAPGSVQAKVPGAASPAMRNAGVTAAGERATCSVAARGRVRPESEEARS